MVSRERRKGNMRNYKKNLKFAFYEKISEITTIMSKK